MSAPKISVILTSYNHEGYIREAIESVLNQTFTDFELIIADDCSTDNSLDVINSYKDNRIKIYKSESNERGIINKVILAGIVKSDLIAIHHSDDVWEREKLEKQYSFLQNHPDIGAVFTKIKIVDEAGKEISDNENLDSTSKAYLNIFDVENRTKEAWLNHFFYYGNCLCHPSVLLRKECYQQVGFYNTYYKQLADFDFWVRLSQQYKIHVLNEKYVCFRMRNNNEKISSQTPKALAQLQFEFFQILGNYRKIGIEQLIEIFPEEKDNIIIDGSVPEYCLAKAAINAENPSAKAFGTILLAELMRKEETREIISKIHNFNLNDFHKIIGSMDLFKTVTISTLEHKISELSKNIDAINEEKTLLVGNISTITQSKSWKITALLRSLDNYFNNSRKFF
jgi:glycosyltransferase involved in cell wall biosynthesis